MADNLSQTKINEIENTENTLPSGIHTVWDMFKHYSEKFKENAFLGRRRLNSDKKPSEYEWRTYQETFQRVNLFSKGLRHIFEAIYLQSEDQDAKNPKCLGIYSVNRPEWYEGFHAASSISLVTVPLYDTLGTEGIKHIISETQLKVILCSKPNVKKLIELKKETKNTVETIIQMDFDEKYQDENDYLSEEDIQLAKSNGIDLISFSHVIEIGKEKEFKEMEDLRPKEENLCLIMYTSGTTGTPKGVMLSHSNAVKTAEICFKEIKGLREGTYFSYLPLAHIFEMIIELCAVMKGCSIGYYRGETKGISGDILKLRPTYMAAVPRVLEKIEKAIKEKVNQFFFPKRLLFKYALDKGLETFKHSPSSESRPEAPFGSSFVWDPIRKQMGFDRLECLVSGGAPLSRELFSFTSLLIKGEVYQSYGLTETFGPVTLSKTQTNSSGEHNVGLPTFCEVRLEAVKDLGYSPESKPPSGEVLVRGPGVFSGYFENPEESSRVLSEDGWFRTGDVARINEDGTLSIVDRVKSLFKLSQGEYLSPGCLEDEYLKSSAVNQIFVYGDSTKHCPVAVVVPDVRWVLSQIGDSDARQKFENDLKSQKFGEVSEHFVQTALIHRKELKEKMFLELKKEEGNLRGFERLGAIFLEFSVDSSLNGFTVQNDCLTPSMKQKRNVLKERYLKEIEKMYEEVLKNEKKQSKR